MRKEEDGAVTALVRWSTEADQLVHAVKKTHSNGEQKQSMGRSSNSNQTPRPQQEEKKVNEADDGNCDLSSSNPYSKQEQMMMNRCPWLAQGKHTQQGQQQRRTKQHEDGEERSSYSSNSIRKDKQMVVLLVDAPQQGRREKK